MRSRLSATRRLSASILADLAQPSVSWGTPASSGNGGRRFLDDDRAGMHHVRASTRPAIPHDQDRRRSGHTDDILSTWLILPVPHGTRCSNVSVEKSHGISNC